MRENTVFYLQCLWITSTKDVDNFWKAIAVQNFLPKSFGYTMDLHSLVAQSVELLINSVVAQSVVASAC